MRAEDLVAEDSKELSKEEVTPVLRDAIRRLMDASKKDRVEVTVRRRDLELLLTIWNEKKGAPLPPKSALDPRQR